MIKQAGYSIIAHSRPEDSGLRGFYLFIFLNKLYRLSVKKSAQILHPAYLDLNSIDQEN